MRTRLIVGFMGIVLLCQCAQPAAVAGQQAGSSPSQGQRTQPIKPLSVPHLYWHFLVYVNVLDHKADDMKVQGKNGDWLRDDLQTRLQFSDADFATIRASSQRLASELATINQQINSLKSATPSASNAAQFRALIVLREADINNEIATLTQTLSPQKRAALEAFMTQFFAPKPLTYRPTASQTNQ
jgi:hypothetical protein